MAARTKGGVLLARREYVTERFGGAGWRQVLRSLPEADRATLDGSLLASAWYPFELNDRLDRAIAAVLGTGRKEIFKDMGAWSARRNLSGPHKAFLAPGEPDRFLASTSTIYSYYYDVGRRTWQATGATSGVITTHDAETFSETDCLTVIGWYEEALKMCGARTVTMTEPECRARGAACCRYEVRWEV